ncbi:hypothetical protein KW797_00850 [Candidatus Parcubacteria bacterium]|nr:hypothetical protein [Candidatus Parcubacteria bacterium]
MKAVMPVGEELSVREECAARFPYPGRIFVASHEPSDHTGMWYTLKDEQGSAVIFKNPPNKEPISQFPAAWFEAATP